MPTYTLNVNGQSHRVDVAPDTPLLWVIRDHLGLTGTRYGCGRALCGACTVLLNGNPTRSCVLPVSAAAGSRITTIEGLSPDGRHPLQIAWIEERVSQCGYCQAGQLMTAAALLAREPNPDESTIREALNGNLCRCGTYQRIVRAVRRAAELMQKGGKS